jgi:hypothetical protein
MDQVKSAAAYAARWVLARAREPSSMGGIAVLLVALGIPHAADLGTPLTQLATAIAGILAIVMPEQK